MDDPTTMDLDQIRDWAARRQGWEYEPIFPSGWYGVHEDKRSSLHPIPPTLDAIAGLMPSGYEWDRCEDTDDGKVWRSFKRINDWKRLVGPVVPDTGNELLDRARLAMLATLAEDRNKEPRP